MFDRIPARKRYGDLALACELARLAFEYSDKEVFYDPRGGGTPFRKKVLRKMWRWPDPIDSSESAAFLERFARRLRARFRPARGSGAAATLPLSGGAYSFDTAARAFEAAGLVLGVFGAIEVVRRSPDFRGGDRPLPGNHPPAIRINADWSAGPASDFFYDRFLRALYACGDVRRLRECPICGRPFVQLRKDRGACSPQCLNTHRQREQRRRWKESGKDYEANRKRNSRAKKARAAGPLKEFNR